jgi:hypothetical protein
VFQFLTIGFRSVSRTPSSKFWAADDESQQIKNSETVEKLAKPAAAVYQSFSPKYEEAIRNTDWACLVQN